MYSGSTSGRKVAEYGGNSHGIGGRGVVRLGWPKDVIKVGHALCTFLSCMLIEVKINRLFRTKTLLSKDTRLRFLVKV